MMQLKEGIKRLYNLYEIAFYQSFRTKFNVLPGLIDVPGESKIFIYMKIISIFIFLAETRFLHIIFDNYPLDNIQFRLLPVYLLYMTIRYRLSPYGKLNLSLIEKQEDVISFLHAIEEMINKKIQVKILH